MTHSYVDPTGKYLLAADLGSDVLRVFDISSGIPSSLPSITLPPGNGPRHLFISPPRARSDRTLIYLIEEMGNTIAVFEVEYPSDKQAAFNLKKIQREVSVLPPDAKDTCVRPLPLALPLRPIEAHMRHPSPSQARRMDRRRAVPLPLRRLPLRDEPLPSRQPRPVRHPHHLPRLCLRGTRPPRGQVPQPRGPRAAPHRAEQGREAPRGAARAHERGRRV